jgi:hypothetical protein
VALDEPKNPGNDSERQRAGGDLIDSAGERQIPFRTVEQPAAGGTGMTDHGRDSREASDGAGESPEPSKNRILASQLTPLSHSPMQTAFVSR